MEIQGLVDVAPGNDAVALFEKPAGKVLERAAREADDEKLQRYAAVTERIPHKRKEHRPQSVEG